MLDRPLQAPAIDPEHSTDLTTTTYGATDSTISPPTALLSCVPSRERNLSGNILFVVGLNCRSPNTHQQAWTHTSQKSCPSLAANASSSACSQDTGDGGCEYRNRNSPRRILGDRREEAHSDDGDASHHNYQLLSTITTHTSIPPTWHT